VYRVSGLEQLNSNEAFPSCSAILELARQLPAEIGEGKADCLSIKSKPYQPSKPKMRTCEFKPRTAMVSHRRDFLSGLVGVAGFHRRNDMHQAGTVATEDKHPGDDVLLADVLSGNVFDGNVSGTGQLGGAFPGSANRG
jgi:hypothetical protein